MRGLRSSRTQNGTQDLRVKPQMSSDVHKMKHERGHVIDEVVMDLTPTEFVKLRRDFLSHYHHHSLTLSKPLSSLLQLQEIESV